MKRLLSTGKLASGEERLKYTIKNDAAEDKDGVLNVQFAFNTVEAAAKPTKLDPKEEELLKKRRRVIEESQDEEEVDDKDLPTKRQKRAPSDLDDSDEQESPQKRKKKPEQLPNVEGAPEEED